MQLEPTVNRRYQTKQEMVYRTLRDAIMQGQLRPGQRIVIEDVAQKLNVSHIPVREALQLLQSERLVENIPHIGATVAQLSPSSVVEVFSVMEGLELAAARIAADRLTPEHIEQFQTLLTSADHALQSAEYNRWSELNLQFHQLIAAITGMPMLIEMTQRAIGQWYRLRQFFFSNSNLAELQLDKIHQEHYALFNSLQARDHNEMERLVKQHKQGIMALYIAQVAEHTD